MVDRIPRLSTNTDCFLKTKIKQKIFKEKAMHISTPIMETSELNLPFHSDYLGEIKALTEDIDKYFYQFAQTKMYFLNTSYSIIIQNKQ